MMKICPYCEQDDLWRCDIREVADNVVICAECDTGWTPKEGIVYGTGKNFDDFMEAMGRRFLAMARSPSGLHLSQ